MKSFKIYNQENPQIYQEFKKIAFQFINRGYKRIGSKMICEIIRYHSMIQGDGVYRVNNVYTADYAREFEKDYPEHFGIFSKRQCRIED